MAQIDGMNEVRAEMRNVFQKLFRMANGNAIEENEVLMNLPHVTYVRNDRHAKLLCQQAHCDEFTDAANLVQSGCRKRTQSACR